MTREKLASKAGPAAGGSTESLTGPPAPRRVLSSIPPWLPDAITLTRIALIPLLLLAAEAARADLVSGPPTRGPKALVVSLLLAIAASDKLDGYLARRTGRPPSRRGAILDATADRLVQWTGTWYLALRASPAFTALPLWLPLLLVGRDATLLAIWVGKTRAGHVSVEHELHGKAATASVFALLMGAALALWTEVVTAGAAVVAGLAVYSTARYAARTVSERSRQGAPE